MAVFHSGDEAARGFSTSHRDIFLADFKDSAHLEAPQMGTGSGFASEARRARR